MSKKAVKRTKALITGVSGQDGTYLAEFLLEKNYDVLGVVRIHSNEVQMRLKTAFSLAERVGKMSVVVGDVCDQHFINNLIGNYRPNEIYNLAASSHVGDSYERPLDIIDVNGLTPTRILEAIRHACLVDSTKFYQASTSELFGRTSISPQNEQTPFHPVSPYGLSKLYAYWAVVNYREIHRVFACNGILYNHESERRDTKFVSRKITSQLAEIAFGKREFMLLGALDAKRDWGHAEDYVKMQWMMLQRDEPRDYVIGTGIQSSVRQFVNLAFSTVGVSLRWTGSGIAEQACVESNHGPYSLIKKDQVVVKISPKFFRPVEKYDLVADSSLAERDLRWRPTISFTDIVRRMVTNDLKIATDLHST